MSDDNEDSWIDSVGSYFSESQNDSGNSSGGSVSSDSGDDSWYSSFSRMFSSNSGNSTSSVKAEEEFSEPSTQPSAYEMTFGGMADQYAKQYGIPTNIFRSAIRRVSDFNPGYSDDSNRKGIAGLSMASNNKSLDPYDLDTAFKSAALMIKDTYSKANNWGLAEESFVANEEFDPEMYKRREEREEIVSDAEKQADAERANKKIWEFTLDDFKAYFAKSAWSILFIIVGFVLIIASLYVVIVKGGDKKNLF